MSGYRFPVMRLGFARCPDCKERPGYHLPGCPSDSSDAACVLAQDEPLPCDEAPPISLED